MGRRMAPSVESCTASLDWRGSGSSTGTTPQCTPRWWSKKTHQTALPPPLFTWPHPSRLFPLPRAEEGAGGLHHDPGGVQEGVGGGPEKSQQGGVCQGLCAVVRAVQIVYSHRRKLCREIVKNKYPSNYHCFLFINTFRYHLDFTSYNTNVSIKFTMWKVCRSQTQ